jgi:transcriptional regulator with XRE-family HTH domain
MAVSTDIRKYRLLRQLTRPELAARLGKRRATMTRYELGSVATPVSALGKIAEALKDPVRNLLASNGKDDEARPSVKRGPTT